MVGITLSSQFVTIHVVSSYKTMCHHIINQLKPSNVFILLHPIVRIAQSNQFVTIHVASPHKTMCFHIISQKNFINL
jgi:hypothetical protein